MSTETLSLPTESEILAKIESLNLDYGEFLRDLEGLDLEDPDTNAFRALAQQDFLDRLVKIDSTATGLEKADYNQRLVFELNGELAGAVTSFFEEPIIVDGVLNNPEFSLAGYEQRLSTLLEGWAVTQKELKAIARRTHKKNLESTSSTVDYFLGNKNIITERKSHLFQRLRNIFRKWTPLTDKAITRHIVHILIAVSIETEPYNKVFSKWEKHLTRVKKRS